MRATPTEAVAHPSSSERILSTALELFAVRGYDATSVREICEAAGITKPTLYHFYKSKDGVLRALVVTAFDQFRGIVNRGLAAPGSFRGRLKIITREVFEQARRQPLVWRFIHGVIWAPPGTTEPPNCTEFYDGVVGSMASAAGGGRQARRVRAGPARRADVDRHGGDQRSRDRLCHFRASRTDARAGGSSCRHDCGRLVTDRGPACIDVYDTAITSSSFVRCRPRVLGSLGARRPHRHSSSRARRPWRRRSRSTPTVKLSLEQVALLEGRITEARADALPDVSWSTRALRSRDPGLLNSPNFDQFPDGVPHRAWPDSREQLRHVRRRAADAVQLQAR